MPTDEAFDAMERRRRRDKLDMFVIQGVVHGKIDSHAVIQTELLSNGKRNGK